ncbi:MAG: AAA family ATPase [Deltaproteobacteria bacterium]|nr:AAA family ATPase [Deltaproteobacteria bacterium]
MYRQFFGFSERPFKLVPDPDYLFLSKSHDEALCHLKYAVDHGEGFVEIIGEVGCGKTMLCRAFLEGLGPETESAYIFNPKMDADDLLCAINDEFGVPPSRGGTKASIDALNLFLMAKRGEGKKAILIIDEAQNLKKDVLEQIRLLSNLETTKEKLLQIILVGQPELGEMLDSYELRQLSQRISLSCILRPLSLKETYSYIRHRVFVASRKSANLFSRGAVRRIYKYSGGIPRLINICCDRVLLTAYGFNRRRISGRIAAAAISELSQRGDPGKSAGKNFSGGVILAGLMLIFVLLAWQAGGIGHMAGFSFLPPATTEVTSFVKPAPSAHKKSADRRKEVKTIESPAPEIKADISGPREIVCKSALDLKGFNKLLENLAAGDSRSESAALVLRKWNTDPDISPDISAIKDDDRFFNALALKKGLKFQVIDGDLDLVFNLGLCAVLRFASPQSSAFVYLAVTGTSPDGLVLEKKDGSEAITTPPDVMIRHWTGKAFVFWKDFYNYKGVIPTSAPGESIITLKMHLREMGYKQVRISPVYDPLTRSVIKALQSAHHIPADGYVGPLTRIVLYNDNPALLIARLQEPESVSGRPVPDAYDGDTRQEPAK